MWVVKLGGSLYEAGCLADWLDGLAALQDRVVVVPGGGPFVDQVRDAQRRRHVDAWHAHAMALLGMEQMGLLLCGMDARLVACDGVAAVRAASTGGRVPVWMAARDVLAQADIAADWSVTSDSLALWLAAALDASGVLLVKSAPLDGDATAQRLHGSGIVDAAFADYARHLDCPVRLVNRRYSADLPGIVQGEARHSVEVERSIRRDRASEILKRGEAS